MNLFAFLRVKALKKEKEMKKKEEEEETATNQLYLLQMSFNSSPQREFTLRKEVLL